MSRLRSRAPRRPGAGWVQPDASGRCTTVGNLDSPNRAIVDPAGLVEVAGRGWSLDWWVGAEDRWHVPSREVAVRQALVGASPVVETRLRVPSGDAIHRVFGARGPSGEDCLVVEVHNDTRVPFALALALRPYGLDGEGRVTAVELDGSTLRVDGQTAVLLPRSPGRIAMSTAAALDSAEAVFAGQAEAVRPAAVRCPDGSANATLLFPLAHAATLRVALPLRPDESAGPGALPSAPQVASGWGLQSRRGARFEVPDAVLAEAVAASTRFLLLGASDPWEAAGLDLMGFPDEAAAVLMENPGRPSGAESPGRALHALAWHWALTRDLDAAKVSAPFIAALVPALAKSSDPEDSDIGRAALPMTAELLEAAGERLGASDVRSVVGPAPPQDSTRAALTQLLGCAGPTWTWPGEGRGHDLSANATLVTLARRSLLREAADGVALSPVVSEAWLGQGWEVHGAPTAWGCLSYAVRWHSERPALLWELEPHAGLPPACLSAPGLDPSWSSYQPKGEALLSPVALPTPTGPLREQSTAVSLERTRRRPRA